MNTTRITRTFLAVFAVFLALTSFAWAEEPVEIPIRARQSFEHKLDSFLVSQKSVQAQLKKFDSEAAKQFRAFSGAASAEERKAASEAMDRTMLTKVSKLTGAFEKYNAKIKDLRKSVVAMANVARVNKTHISFTPRQFDQAMVSFEPIARELSRIGLGRDAAALHSLASEIANKYRVRLANRTRARQHFTTGYISGLSEELHAIEAKLMALTGTLKEMVKGIQQAHTARDVNRMKSKVEQLRSLGGGLTSTYLNGYGKVLDYMMGDSQSAGMPVSSGSYDGQAFPRISQAKVTGEEKPQ